MAHFNKDTAMLKFFVRGAALAALISSAASADEVYNVYVDGESEWLPNMIYESDNGAQAVWALQDGSARFYIDGMGGVFNNRHSYSGYFVVYNDPDGDNPPCASGPATDHNGYQVPLWGYLSINWSNDSNWKMSTSECNGPVGQGDTLIGKNAYQ